MSIASEITRINTNIANSYTAVDNKNGTLPQVQNSANLASAIDSIEVIEQATAEGESLSLVNTKAMPYSDYVVEGKSEQGGEPSPSNPSEIYSVADDVNLLNEETLTHGQLLSNNVIISSQTRMGYSDFINISNFTNITIKLNSNTIYRLEKVYYYDISKNEISYELISINSKILTLPINTVYVRISITTTNWSSTVTFDEVKDDLHIKLQKGTKATPYSPYNQGTVTIKQRGKNCIDTSSTTISNGVTSTQNSDGSITSTGTTTGGYFNITNVTSFKLPAGTYTFSINSTRNYLTVLTMKNANNTDENKYIGIGNKSITFTTTEEKVKFFVWSYSTSGVEINETISYQLEERNNINPIRTISS